MFYYLSSSYHDAKRHNKVSNVDDPLKRHVISEVITIVNKVMDKVKSCYFHLSLHCINLQMFVSPTLPVVFCNYGIMTHEGMINLY